MSKLRNALSEADKVKPIAEKNGVKICSPSDARKLIEEELLDPTPDLRTRVVNPDGTIARSRVLIAQVSPERMFGNKYKRQGTKGVGYDELWVVPSADLKGYRAVEQGMEDRNIPVYIVTKDKDTGEFYLKGRTTVDYQKFASEFTHTLDEETMKMLLPLFAEESREITPDNINDLFK